MVSLSFSSKAVDCSTDTVGLCTPTIEQIIEETVTETIDYEADGYTVTTETTTNTTTTTVENEDSGDILDGDNGYVTSTKEGDMDSDWGGQGPASMRTGTYCGDLGTDKCAEITGSGNTTSTMGVDCSPFGGHLQPNQASRVSFMDQSRVWLPWLLVDW